MRRLLSSLVVLVTVAACASERAELSSMAGGPGTGTGSGAIINGQEDETHPAVVAVFSGSGTKTTLCSGTIVKKDIPRQIGWVVTAAHCVDTTPTVVVQAADLLSRDALRYAVIDYAADPNYSGEVGFLHDFAVLRVAGINASTPVIPLAEGADALETGSAVTSVGFGRITKSEPTANSQNTKRNAVDKKLSMVNDNHVAFDQRASGICMGDSGGPVLAAIPREEGEDGETTTAEGDGDGDDGTVESAPTEHVVAVHSFVQGGCDGRGVSGRTSVAASFFSTQLAKLPPADECNLCLKIAASGTNRCAVAAAECRADPSCFGFTRCVSAQKSVADCAKEFPLGEGPYRQTAACACTKVCTNECARDAKCSSVAKCGYKMGGASCTTCVDSACCAEEIACAADPMCVACMRNGAVDPRCAENVARTKLAACASVCTDACTEKPAAPAITPPDNREDTSTVGDEDLTSQAESEVPSGGDPPTVVTVRRVDNGCSATGVGTTSGSPFPVALPFALAMSTLSLVARRRRRRPF
jgi:myeloblastin